MINLYYLGVKEWYLNQSFSDVKGRRPKSFDDKNDLSAFKLFTVPLETQFAESAINWKNILRLRRSIFIISASIIDIWTKVSPMLKDVVQNRLNKRTTWFHLNCWLYHWKRSAQNPQKIGKTDFVREHRSLLSLLQWKICEPNFQRC